MSVGQVLPVGVAEIGERLGVRQQTVAQWRQRGVLPAPRWTVSRLPAWNWPDIERWAADRPSLEIYSRLSLGDAQKTYDQNIGRFPV